MKDCNILIMKDRYYGDEGRYHTFWDGKLCEIGDDCAIELPNGEPARDGDMTKKRAIETLLCMAKDYGYTVKKIITVPEDTFMF